MLFSRYPCPHYRCIKSLFDGRQDQFFNQSGRQESNIPPPTNIAPPSIQPTGEYEGDEGEVPEEEVSEEEVDYTPIQGTPEEIQAQINELLALLKANTPAAPPIA